MQDVVGRGVIHIGHSNPTGAATDIGPASVQVKSGTRKLSLAGPTGCRSADRAFRGGLCLAVALIALALLGDRLRLTLLVGGG